MAGVKGLAAALARLDALQAAIPRALEIAVRQTAEKTAADARREAPAGGGSQAAGSGSTSLKGSITSETASAGGIIEGKVICNSPHAAHVEFGTGWPVGHRITKEIRPKGRAPYRIQGWIFPIGGSFRVTKGMPPRPYMLPAAKGNRTTFRQAIIDQVERAIK